MKNIMNERKSNLGSIVNRRKELDKMPYRDKSQGSQAGAEQADGDNLRSKAGASAVSAR